MQNRLISALQDKSFRKVQSEFGGVSIGTLSRVAKGDPPKDPEIRLALGLPVLAVPCSVCGKTHHRDCKQSFRKRLKGKPDAAEIYAIYLFLKYPEIRQALREQRLEG